MNQTVTVENVGKKYASESARTAGSSLNETIPSLIATTIRLLSPKSDQWTERAQIPEEPENWALKNVSFDLYPGDVLGILGRNGAGKSTLLKILSRVIYPTEGEIAFRGRVGSLLEVGAGFHPELSGRDNIFLAGSILGMKRSEIRQRFNDIVNFAEIKQSLDMPVKHYSNGMFVRLAFSVAAYLDPDILIIDEVLAVGDVRFQMKCREKIRELTGPAKTILMVSHDLSAIANLCNKGMLLEKGCVAASGSIRECVDRYMGTGSDMGKTSWKGNLGDDSIRLHSAFIRTDDSSSILQRGDQLEFQFTYEVLRPGPLVVVGLDIRNPIGGIVCATRFTDVGSQAEINSLQTAGAHTVRLQIDTSILAEGEYIADVNLGLHNVKRIIQHDPVISFSVVDKNRNRMHDSPMYRTVVYPDWKWQELDAS